MIGDLKPYAEYKDSGLSWLGEVPKHWSVKRAKGLFTKMNRPSRENDEVVTCFRDGTVTLRKKRRLRGYTESIKEIGYQGVRRGDLVIHAMDAFAGAIGVSDSDGKGTPVYAVCQPQQGVNANFYAHLVREMARSQWILALAKGIRERSTDFRFDTFASSLVPLPPIDEQTAIATFLDYADRRIRRYIRSKQKLIKLLEEQKQVMINEVVTRGLDPDVPMKRSRLGEIPKHWNALQLRRLITTVTSGSRGWAEFYSDDGDVFLQSGNLGRSMELNVSFIQYVQPPKGSEGTRTKVERGDILICITGALTGNVVFVDIDLPTAYVNQHVALVRPKCKEVSPRYLAYCLYSRTCQSQFKTTEYGGTKQGLNLDDVKSVLVLVPPRSEQESIVSLLDEKLKKLKIAIDRTRQEIAFIQEFRTRLIADIVTGKLDVREAAANLPPEINNLEPLDEDMDEDGMGLEDELDPDTALEDDAA
jgi:type I restriction enzyme, S subunit